MTEQITKLREYFCDACEKKLDSSALCDENCTSRMFCDYICAAAWWHKNIKPQLSVVVLIDGKWERGRIQKNVK